MTRPVHRIRRLTGFIVLGALSGVLAGLSSYLFLELLDRVTQARLDHDWLIWLLPLGGVVIGLGYHRFGGRAKGGTGLAVDQARAYTEGTPGRMAPMVLAGTVLGHLVGASVGREGTAVQMSSSLTDAAARAGRLDHDQRATLARAALAGGFGAVFGVPWAGIVFALEVSRRRTLRSLFAAVPAAFVGDAVVRALGHDHAVRAAVHVPFEFGVLAKLIVAAIVFGLAARLFAAGVPRLKSTMARLITWTPLRPAIGGAATLALVVLFGRDYLGLSLPLLDGALGSAHISWRVPVLKMLFTIVALGTGFVGGEVTPLFVVGGTLGAVLAGPLHLPQAILASLGLVAVFGAAAHVPVACAVMAAELFGAPALLPALLVCWTARRLSGRTGIYDRPVSDARAPAPAGAAAHGSARRSR